MKAKRKEGFQAVAEKLSDLLERQSRLCFLSIINPLPKEGVPRGQKIKWRRYGSFGEKQ